MPRKKTEVNPIVGERIKELRKQTKISQLDLANKLGYEHGNTVLYWEKGRSTVPPQVLDALSDIFNVSIYYLLGKTNTKEDLYPEADFKKIVANRLSEAQTFGKYLSLLGFSFDIDQFGKYDLKITKYFVEHDGFSGFKQFKVSHKEFTELRKSINEFIEFKIDKLTERKEPII